MKKKYSYLEAYTKLVKLREILRELYDISPFEAALLLWQIDLMVRSFKGEK